MRARLMVAVAFFVSVGTTRAYAAGAVFAPPIDISSTPTTAFATGTQQLFVDRAGNGAAVWEQASDINNANVRDIYLSFSSGAQIAFSSPVNVSKSPIDVTGGDPGPRAAIDRNLTIYVVWSTPAFGGGRKIALAISHDNGQSFTNKAITSDGAFDPDVAVGPNGELYVAWGHDTNADGATDDIEVIRSDDGGGTFTAPLNISNTAGPAFTPSIRVDDQGALYACWIDRTPNATGILFSKSTDGGKSFSAAALVPQSTVNSRRQRMAVDPTGNVSIIWSEKNNAILFSHSSDQGMSFSTELPLQGVNGGQVFDPDVVADRTGKVHTTFASGTIDNRLIAYAPFQVSGSYTITDFVTSNNGFHGNPSIAADGASNVDITWFEDVGPTRDVMISHPPIPNMRYLFVPVGNWTSDSDFSAAATEEVTKLVNGLPVSACAGLIETTIMNPSKGKLDSITCGPGDCGGTALPAIRQFAKDNGFDPNQFDVIVGVLPHGGSPCAPTVGCSNFVDTLWFEAKQPCPVLAHETGHIFKLKDEYTSEPAGCTDSEDRCNDGGPSYCMSFCSGSAPCCDTINWLGADEGCDPRAGQGCCGTCGAYSSVSPICCTGNEDTTGKERAIMSYCGASSHQAWDQRSIDHLVAAGTFGCEYRGVAGTALDVTLSLPESGGAVLGDYVVQVSRPTVVAPSSYGDTMIRMKYLDGPVIFTDTFPTSYSYNGVVYPNVDYSGIHYSTVERRVRVPVGYDASAPRPTTMEVIRQGNEVFRGTIFGHPPIADAGPAQTVECTGNGSAGVTLDGSRSSDPDGDLLTFTWSGPFGTANGVTPSESFPLGTSTVGLEVTDGVFPAVSAQTQVTVQDTQPPTLTVAPSPNCLWAPDHEMVLYTLEDLGVQVSDTCDPSPSVKIVAVSSDQPAQGGGSGNTGPDIVFGSGAVCVRAERAGTLPSDRTYHVTVQASDTAGNVTTRDAVIVVPHDQGQTSCAAVDNARVVPDGDPRCGASAPQAASPVELTPTTTVQPSLRSTEPVPQPQPAHAGGCSASGSAPDSGSGLLLLLLAIAGLGRLRQA